MKVVLIAVTVTAACAAVADFVPMRANVERTDWLKVGLWAHPLVMDWDRDGRLDLVVTTPCVPSCGTYFFRNLGNGIFARPVCLSTTSAWEAVLSHADGKPVVLVPKGAIWDFKGSFAENEVRPLVGVPVQAQKGEIRGNVRRFVDFDGDGREDVLFGHGCWTPYGWTDSYDERGVWKGKPIASPLFWCRRLEGLGAESRYAPPVELRLKDGGAFETFGNPAPMAEDWDDDGDLDILCGSFLDSFHYFENVGTRKRPEYVARGKLTDAAGRPLTMDLEMIRPTAVDWDGDGRLDLVVGDEDGRVAWLRNAGRLIEGMPVFDPSVYFRQEADLLAFGALVTPSAVDWDDDGDIDLVCGNSAGRLAFVENLSGAGVGEPRWAEPVLLRAGGAVIRIQAGENGSINGPAEAKWGYTTPCAADWDGDGFVDIVVNSIFGDVVWYRNPGKRGALDLESARPVEVEWDGEQPALAWGWRKPCGKALLTQWRTTPVAFDWNRDGLIDLVMLDQEGYLAYFERFRTTTGALALHAPRRIFAEADGTPLRLNESRASGSGRRKLCLCDWDGDGLIDLIQNAKNAIWFRNLGEKDGTVRLASPEALGKRILAGHSTAPTAADFDGDGRPELVLGAEDGYLYLLRR